MARRKRSKARKPGPQPPPAAPAAANELKAVSRAQLGRDEDERAHRPLPYDASVEDPLQDWPEDS